MPKIVNKVVFFAKGDLPKEQPETKARTKTSAKGDLPTERSGVPKEICPKEPVSNAKGDLPSKSANTHDGGNLSGN